MNVNVDLRRAERLYVAIRRMSVSALVCGGVAIALEAYLPDLAIRFMLVGSLLSLVGATLLFAFLGNALGRFGLKYWVPVVLVAPLGFAYGFFRLRYHLIKARERSQSPMLKAPPDPSIKRTITGQ